MHLILNTLCLSVQICCYIAATCLFLHVMFRLMSVLDIDFLMCSNCPELCMCLSFEPRLLYAWTTCFIYMAIVAAFSFFMSSALLWDFVDAVLSIKALNMFFALNLKALAFLGVNEDHKFHTIFYCILLLQWVTKPVQSTIRTFLCPSLFLWTLW